MKRKIFLASAAVLLTVAAVCSVVLVSVIRGGSGKSGLLEVYYFNVGQGDSSLAVFPDGTTVMTDTGSGGGFLPEYFSSLGIKRIDCLILTHPHSDHVGGAGSIADKLDVGMII
ncbi:MAG: MBL fold metallo-hydrolase, partial [Firmicutes bacterium]|nr:MBL fold metallo-hydrolase [Candidatus Colimorpha enterica]